MEEIKRKTASEIMTNKILAVSVATLTLAGTIGGIAYELNGSDSNSTHKTPTINLNDSKQATPTKNKPNAKSQQVTSTDKAIPIRTLDPVKPKTSATNNSNSKKNTGPVQINDPIISNPPTKNNNSNNNTNKSDNSTKLHTILSKISPPSIPTIESNSSSKTVMSNSGSVNSNGKNNDDPNIIAPSGSVPGIKYVISKDADKVWTVTGTFQGKDIEKTTELAEKYPNGRIPDSLLCTFKNIKLRCDAAAQLSQLNGSYHAKFGSDLNFVQGYRSLAEQYAVKADWTAKGAPGMASTPGTSNHGLGLAIDLGAPNNVLSTQHTWLVNNAPSYGWNWPMHMRPEGVGPHEPWHFEFNGPGLNNMDKNSNSGNSNTNSSSPTKATSVTTKSTTPQSNTTSKNTSTQTSSTSTSPKNSNTTPTAKSTSSITSTPSTGTASKDSAPSTSSSSSTSTVTPTNSSTFTDTTTSSTVINSQTVSPTGVITSGE